MFGESLKSRRQAARMSLDALARASKLSKTYIANIENNKPHPTTGTLPSPSRETVEKLANALEWPVDLALSEAGYTPKVLTEPDADVIEIAGIIANLDKRERERAKRLLREFAAT